MKYWLRSNIKGYSLDVGQTTWSRRKYFFYEEIRANPSKQNKTKFGQSKSPFQRKAVSFRGRQMVQVSCRVGPRSSTLKIDRNFNFAFVVLLLSMTIFVISLCCPFWPVLEHFVVSRTGTYWFIFWKGEGMALNGRIEGRLMRILSVLSALGGARKRGSQVSWEPRKNHHDGLTKIRIYIDFT